MQNNRSRDRAWIWLLTAGILMLAAGLVLLWHELPPADETDATHVSLVAPGCKQAQTIDYQRCGHQVVRRIDAPPMWTGMTKEAVQAAMEEGWRMTGFSPLVIEMSSAQDMFCPQHWVLTLARDGSPAIYRNQYGFSMEKTGEVTLRTQDEATREKLARGIAFDTREELDAWVKAWNEAKNEGA